jgi:sporulation protein YqfC
MKKWQGRMKHWIAKQFNLPQDVMLELPRITTIGHLHAYIENHQGLVTFTENEILLKMRRGYVRVQGENFVLKTMLKEEIILEGKITEIKFIDS